MIENFAEFLEPTADEIEVLLASLGADTEVFLTISKTLSS